MDIDELRTRLAGVVAIPVTPFSPQGAVDEVAYSNLLTRMSDAGVDVVTPNGNTSEYYSLTEAETEHAVELTVSAVGSQCVIIAGVGNDVMSAIKGSQQAREAGAHAIMVHQPVNPFVSRDGWFEYHRQIAAGVPDLGVVVYLRNPRIDGATIAKLADAAPNLVAVKYAVPDPVRFATVLRECNRERLIWIAGLAELSAPGYWAVGATGFTSGFVNVAPTLSLEMLGSLRTGDFSNAMKVWDQIRPFEELRARGESENNVSVVKESLAQLGLCRRDVRPPSSTLNESDRKLVGEMIQSWGASF